MGQLDRRRGRVPEVGGGNAVSATVPLRTEPTKPSRRRATSSVGDLERPRPGQSLRPGGSELPDTPSAPTRKPPENFFQWVFPRRPGQGRRGRASGRYGLRAGRGRAGLRGQPPSSPCPRPPPGPPLGISGATRWHPVPRRRICAAAELALLPELGRMGGSHRPTRRVFFWSCRCDRASSRSLPQHFGRGRPEAPRKPRESPASPLLPA